MKSQARWPRWITLNTKILIEILREFVLATELVALPLGSVNDSIGNSCGRDYPGYS